MQDSLLFEYAVIRVVPKVEREEFMNIGVILYCRQKRFLQAMFSLNEDRLRAFAEDMDMELLSAYLTAFRKICEGDKDGGPIASLDVASRFRWLTATRSTILQTSKVHPGFCNDPQEALVRLFEQMVL